MIQTAHDEQGHQYYDLIYAGGYTTKAYLPLYNQVLKMIEQAGSQANVLEIGCGIGDLGKMIINRGHTYRGFDFSPIAIQRCQQLVPNGAFAIGDAYNPAAYVPHNYDTAVALEVLEHLDDLRIIENIPPGVRLIASVPDYDDIAHVRLYQDPQRDIIERFQPLLKVTNICWLPVRGSSNDPKKVYIFDGIRLSEDQTPIVDSHHGHATQQKRAGRNDPCPCGSGQKYKRCCMG